MQVVTNNKEAGLPRPPSVGASGAWARTAAEVLAEQRTDVEKGLDNDEVIRRAAVFGPNRLAAAPRQAAWRVVIRQFRGVVVALLTVAAAASFAFGDTVEGVAVVVVLLLNAAIGATTELRAVRSMEALHEFDRMEVLVRRDGMRVSVPSDGLVPGDIVLLAAGDVVAADARIVEAARVQVNESTLTGESVPVEKSAGTIDATAVLAERTNMLFMGTSITRGSTVGVVTATGLDSELGRISALIARPGGERTPLEQRLSDLGRRLVWVTLAIAGLVAISTLVTDRDVVETIKAAVALAVAAVPEGLPIVATLALARGMLRMAKRDALVERLSAVETLGSTSVILTDKTGTLTENKMTVKEVAVVEGTSTERALVVAALCNEAMSDPMEIALIDAASASGIDRDRLLERMPQLREEPFDPAVKMMATYHRSEDGVLVAVKGAPERVIAACVDEATASGTRPLAAASWLARVDSLAQKGLRILAVADKRVSSPLSPPYAGLTLVGLIALWDPPRAGVAASIEACKRAGIDVVMVTGDHDATARAIGDAVGVTTIHSRVTPEDKLELLEMHQEAGGVVAMIGDGVNDAPALKRADIGVAMGRRGTQVAREASAMVLLDDRFETIVDAIANGRAIFDNIRRFVVYLLSCNISEILVVGLASMVDAPLPILPLQILFLNLVTDVFPALALATTPTALNVLDRSPRPRDEAILTRGHWRVIGTSGAVITAAVLGGGAVARMSLDLSPTETVTVSFLILAFAQLVHVFDMGSDGRFVNEVSRNRVVWIAVAVCVALLVGAVYLGPMAAVLGIAPLDAAGWALVVAMSLLPLAALRIVTVRP